MDPPLSKNGAHDLTTVLPQYQHELRELVAKFERLVNQHRVNQAASIVNQNEIELIQKVVDGKLSLNMIANKQHDFTTYPAFSGLVDAAAAGRTDIVAAFLHRSCPPPLTLLEALRAAGTLETSTTFLVIALFIKGIINGGSYTDDMRRDLLTRVTMYNTTLTDGSELCMLMSGVWVPPTAPPPAPPAKPGPKPKPKEPKKPGPQRDGRASKAATIGFRQKHAQDISVVAEFIRHTYKIDLLMLMSKRRTCKDLLEEYRLYRGWNTDCPEIPNVSVMGRILQSIPGADRLFFKERKMYPFRKRTGLEPKDDDILTVTETFLAEYDNKPAEQLTDLAQKTLEAIKAHRTPAVVEPKDDDESLGFGSIALEDSQSDDESEFECGDDEIEYASDAKRKHREAGERILATQRIFASKRVRRVESESSGEGNPYIDDCAAAST